MAGGRTEVNGPLGHAAESPRFGRLRRQLESSLPPILVVLAFLVGWDASVYFFEVPQWLLPRVYLIFSVTIERWPEVQMHSLYTLKVIVLSFLVAVGLGVPLAVTIAYCRAFERAVYPLLVFSQTLPKIAVAPLFAIWMGMTIMPHILVAFLISFFPIVLDTVIGLKSVPPEMISLARSMGARQAKTFWKISLPFALPYIFTGMKVGITLAVVGALVGEWVGSERGLGYLLLTAYGDLDTALTFAAVFVLAVMGVGLFYAIRIIERMLISWHVSERLGRGEVTM